MFSQNIKRSKNVRTKRINQENHCKVISIRYFCCWILKMKKLSYRDQIEKEYDLSMKIYLLNADILSRVLVYIL